MERLKGLDVARAFALLGMMLVNYKLVFQVQDSSWLYGLMSLLEGRAVAVFIVLAGIGLGLMTRQARVSRDVLLRRKVRRQLIIRAIFLWVLGLILWSVFEWSADILHYYGAYMLLVIPFLYMAPKKLDWVLMMILGISVFLQVRFNYLSGWEIETFNYVDFYTIKGFLRNLFFNGFHPIFPWFGFMLLGLRLSQIDLSSSDGRQKLLKRSFAFALLIEILSAGLIAASGHHEWVVYLVDTKPMPANLFYMLGASSWAIAFIVLVLMVVDRWQAHSHLLTAMIKTGQLSLTHYVGHSALVLTIASLMGLIQEQTAAFVVLLSFGVYGLMVAFSYLWSKKFSRGPIESLMRALSDGGI